VVIKTINTQPDDSTYLAVIKDYSFSALVVYAIKGQLR